MCIIFAYVNSHPKVNGYQIIMANNRDEYYDRPTKPADFWEGHPDCIGSLDMDPKRGNGTWFGVSKQGKISTLLNILDNNTPDHSKKGRGILVSNFVTGNVSGCDYMQRLKEDKLLYNKFNLLTFDKRDGEWRVEYLGTDDDDSPYTIDSEIIAASNSAYRTPWNKVGYGHDIFEKLISEYGVTSSKDQLVSGLLQLLKDRTRLLPDTQLESQGERLTAEMLQQRSAIYVDTPQIRYGSRTHTLLLVDADDNATYIEHSVLKQISETVFFE